MKEKRLGAYLKTDFIAAAFFLILFFSLVSHNLWNKEISHTHPYGLSANDAFDHFTDVEFLLDDGSYKYIPPYMAAGYTNAVTYDMPLLYHLGAIFSKASGLESYDAVYFLVMVFFALSAIIFFLIVRDESKTMAMLSLPVSLLVFFKIFPSVFTWGQWLFIAGAFFLLFFYWAFKQINLASVHWLMAVALTATIMAHFSEAVFGVMFFILYVVFALVRGMKKRQLKVLTYAGLITFAISFFFIFHFMSTMYTSQKYTFSVMRESSTKTTILLTSFPWWALIFIVIGAFCFALLALKKKYYLSVTIAGFMLLIGYLNYVGFGERAFQTRYSWPIYISVFFGMGLYQTLRFFLSKRYDLGYSLAAFFVVSLVITSLAYGDTVQSGLMNQERYDAFLWLNSNTDKNATTLILYFDGYNQKRMWNIIKRRVWGVNFDDYVNALKQKLIKRAYLLRENISPIFLKRSFLKYERVDVESETIIDICNFHYFYIEKSSAYFPVLATYNTMIQRELINNGLTEVYKDGHISILMNSQPGTACLPEEGVEIQ